MADVSANIIIDVNSTAAIANLRRLQTQIAAFQKSVVSANSGLAAQQAAWNASLLSGIGHTGMFNARMVTVADSVTRFSDSLEKGRFSLGQYTRYAASSLPGMSRVFRKEFDTISQVAESRVKRIQTQYLALGKTVDGMTKAIAATPTALAPGYMSSMAMATQRQQIFNRLINDGSTKLLNWGKNTQWAGRQLMVGFSIPLAALGAVAAKTFMEIDKATLSLRRVYGDLTTTTAEIDRNIEAVQRLGQEYMKYGISVAQSTEVAAKAAATGAQNETLMAATEQTLRFATLGQIDYNQALESTIALQTAFGISNSELASKIDFLNAVENQTILTIDDMSLAIPRVATVIKGLGGSVEDLAVMMTAMREGGVSAENAANALKSGLASLINPTKRATESMGKFGINITEIVNKNKGDLMGLITDFANATNALDEFSRQQVFEQTFGKYQYARMSALFTNITKDSGQAARAMDLTKKSVQELAAISDKELSAISETTSVKFKAAVENLKTSIAPLGEAFLKVLTPIANAISSIANAFNHLPDSVKNVIAIITGVIAGIGPVLVMTLGLFANAIANIVKVVQFFRKSIARIRGDASAFEYLSNAELESVTATKALEASSQSLTGKLLLQREAVAALTLEYEKFAAVAGIAGVRMGGVGGRGAMAAGARPFRLSEGGTVPGTGNKDTIPALLTPGETVVTKEASQKYGSVINAMNDGTLPGFNGGKDKKGAPKLNVNQPQSSMDVVHKSHLLGFQSQNTISSLRAAWIESANNPEMRNMLIESFRVLFGSGNSNVYRDGEDYKIGQRGYLKGSNLNPNKPLTKREITKRINEFLGMSQNSRALTRLNPVGYRGVSIAAGGSKNSVFLESDFLPPAIRGGEAFTLSEFKEQAKLANILIKANKDGNSTLTIAQDGSIYGIKNGKQYRYGQSYAHSSKKPKSIKLSDALLSGALEIIKENNSISKGNNRIKTDVDFINHRQYQLLATGVADSSKTIKEKLEMEEKLKEIAKKRVEQLKALKIIDEQGSVIPGKLEALKGLVLAQAIATSPEEIGLNPDYHRWIGTTIPEEKLSNTKFRELVSSSGKINRQSKIDGIFKINPSMSRFLRIPRIGRYNTGGPIFASNGVTVPGVGNTDTVPAMLTPGEFVVNKGATKQNLPLLHAINDGNVSQSQLGFNKGGFIPTQHFAFGGIAKQIQQAYGQYLFSRYMGTKVKDSLKMGLLSLQTRSGAILNDSNRGKTINFLQNVGLMPLTSAKKGALSGIQAAQSQVALMPEMGLNPKGRLKTIENRSGYQKQSDIVKVRLLNETEMMQTGSRGGFYSPTSNEIIIPRNASQDWKSLPENAFMTDRDFVRQLTSHEYVHALQNSDERRIALDPHMLIGRGAMEAQAMTVEQRIPGLVVNKKQTSLMNKAQEILFASSDDQQRMMASWNPRTEKERQFKDTVERLINTYPGKKIILSLPGKRSSNSFLDKPHNGGTNIDTFQRSQILSSQTNVDDAISIMSRLVTKDDLMSTPNSFTRSFYEEGMKLGFMTPRVQRWSENQMRLNRKYEGQKLYINDPSVERIISKIIGSDQYLALRSRYSVKGDGYLTPVDLGNILANFGKRRINSPEKMADSIERTIDRLLSRSSSYIPKAVPFDVIRANNGIEVPGVGNTDTVPAMLTPGEFVVNKQSTAENLPLLHAINDGNVSQSKLGFNKGGKIPGVQYFAANEPQRIVQPDNPYATHFAHGTDFLQINDEEAVNRYIRENLSAENTRVQDVLRAQASEGIKKTVRLYTNWVYDVPKIANQQLFTGTEYSRLFTEGAIREQTMAPIKRAISKAAASLGTSLPPDAIRTVTDHLGKTLTSELAKIQTDFVTDPQLYAANEKAMQQLMKENLTPEMRAAVEKAYTEITTARPQAYDPATRTTISPSRVQVEGATRFYKGDQRVGWDTHIGSILTEEGNALRAAAAQRQQFAGRGFREANPIQSAEDQRRIAEEMERQRIEKEEMLKTLRKIDKETVKQRKGEEKFTLKQARIARQKAENEVRRQMIQQRAAEIEKGMKIGTLQEELDYLKRGGKRVVATQQATPEIDSHLSKVRQYAKEMETIEERTLRYRQAGMSGKEAKSLARAEIQKEDIAARRDFYRKQSGGTITLEEATRLATADRKAAMEEKYGFTDKPKGGGAKAAAAEKLSFGQRMKTRIGAASAKFAPHASGLGMGISMASMAPAMMADEEGKFLGINANAAMMGMMGGGTLLSLLPMMGGAALPVAAVGAAAAAIGVALWKWRDTVDNTARQSAKLGAALGGATNAVGTMASILGVQDPVKARQYTQLAVKPNEQKDFAEYYQRLQEGPGKQLVTSLQGMSSEQKFQNLNDYVRNAIASELLTKEQAQLFAKAVGAALNDQLLGLRVAAGVNKQSVGSKALLSIAKEREATVLQNKGIANVVNAKSGTTLDTGDASAAIGAGTQIMKAYAQAIAKAEQEYKNQTIAMEDYVKIINEANDATAKWSDVVSRASIDAADSGAAKQAAITSMDLAGVPEAVRKGIDDSYSTLITDMAGQKGAGQMDWFGGMHQYLANTRDKNGVLRTVPFTINTEGAFKQLEKLAQEKGYGTGIQGVEAFAAKEDLATVKKAFEAANAYGEDILAATEDDALKTVIQTLVANGQDAQVVMSQAQAIFNDPIALEAFNKAGKNVEAFAKALDVANSTILFSSNDFRSRFQDLSDSFLSPEYKNAATAFISIGQTEEERAKRMATLEGVGRQMVGKDISGSNIVNYEALSGNNLLASRMNYLDIYNTASQYYSPETVDALLANAKERGLFNNSTLTQQQYQYGGFGGIPSSTGTYFGPKYNATAAKNFKGAIDEAGKAGVTQVVIDYAIKISGQESKDPTKTLEELTKKFTSLKDLEPEILYSLNIDLNKGEDIDKYGNDVEAIKRGWDMLSALNPNIDITLVASAVLKDANGDIIDDPVQTAKNIMEINKAFNDLAKAKNKKTKLEAQISLAEVYMGDNGPENVSGEDVVNKVKNTLKEIGKELNDLPSITASQIIQIQSNLEVLNAPLNAKILSLTEQANALIEAGNFKGAGILFDQVAKLTAQVNRNNKNAQAQILTAAIGAGSEPGGGGGGQENWYQALLRQAKEALKILNMFSNIIKDKAPAFKAFISGPFAPEFIDFLRQQGIEAVTVLNGSVDKFRKAYDAWIQKDQRERMTSAKLFPLEIRRQKETQYAKRALTPKMSAKGIDADVQSTILEQMGPQAFIAAKALEKKPKQRTDIEKGALEIFRTLISPQSVQVIKDLNAELRVAQVEIGKTSLKLSQMGVPDSIASMWIEAGYNAEDFANALKKPNSELGKILSNILLIEKINIFKQLTEDLQSANREAENMTRIFALLPNAAQEVVDTLSKINLDLLSDQDIKNYAGAIDFLASKQEKAKSNATQLSEAISAQTNVWQREIEKINLLEIKPFENAIQGIQAYIQGLSDQIEDIQRNLIRPLEDQIKELQDSIGIIQDQIDALQKVEDETNKVYDKRIEALNKVFSINERIAAQQQSQLNVAQALSQGDVYAAAQAMQEMSGQNAGYAREDLMKGLETEKQNAILAIQDQIAEKQKQIDSINAQIEERQNKIEQYNRRIRDIQDQIYEKQKEIAAIQKQIEDAKRRQLELEERIYKVQLMQSALENKRNYESAITRGDKFEAQRYAMAFKIDTDMLKSLGWANVPQEIIDMWNQQISEGGPVTYNDIEAKINESQMKSLASWNAFINSTISNYSVSTDQVSNALKNAGLEYSRQLTEAGKEVPAGITKIINDILGSSKNLNPTEFMSQLQKNISEGINLGTINPEQASAFMSIFGTAITDLATNSQNVATSTGKVGTETEKFSAAVTKITGSLTTLQTAFETLLTNIRTFSSTFVSSLGISDGAEQQQPGQPTGKGGGGSGIMNAISKAIAGVIAQANPQETINKIFEPIINMFKPGQGIDTTGVQAVITQIAKTMKQMVSTLEPGLTSFIDNLSAILSSSLNNLAGVSETAVNAFLESLRQKLSGITIDFTPNPIVVTFPAMTLTLGNNTVDVPEKPVSAPIPQGRAGTVTIPGAFTGGPIIGTGSRDSVPVMSAPGEFIMRRAAVDKYGSAMLSAMNAGSYSMPKYDIPEVSNPTINTVENRTNVVSPVYNTYSVNVPVNQPGASADEIAHKVITKIRDIDSMAVRSFRGY